MFVSNSANNSGEHKFESSLLTLDSSSKLLAYFQSQQEVR